MAEKTIGKKIILERGAFNHALEDMKSKSISDKKSPENKIIENFVNENKKKGLRIFVAGGSRSGNLEIYADEAYKLGQIIGKMGFKLDFGLSSKGIMGAVAKGVMDIYNAKGEQSPINAITTDMYLSFYENDNILKELENIIVAKTLEERKRMLLEADFIVFAPGGIGTLDELVYDCVAMQDGMLPPKPFIILNVNGFFYHLLEFLKHINLTGFADRMPFIVVDNMMEAEIIFESLKSKKLSKIDLNDLYSETRELIYFLPYFVKQKELYPHRSVQKIIAETKKSLQSDDKQVIQILRIMIEREYLKKETERMYLRFSYAAKDVSTQGDKLDDLLSRAMKQKKATDTVLF